MAKPGANDERLKAAIDFLFEALTLRPPTKEETAAYLRIIKKSIEILRELGPGLLESTYETCLVYELSSLGLKV